MSTVHERIRAFFKSNIGFIMVIAVSLAYIATGLITIDHTGKTVLQMVADGAMSLLFGMSTNRFFDLQGIIKGENDDRFLSTVKLHGQAVEKITPYIDKLDDWCVLQNERVLKMQREKILIGVGLRYDDYFDESGAAKPFDIAKPPRKEKVKRENWKRQHAAYKRTLKLKLTQLTASTLTSEGVNSDDPNYLGRTKQDYEKKTIAMEVLWKLFTAALFGYYAFRFVKEIDIGLLIGAILQVTLYLLFGVLKMYTSFNFIVDEYRQRIIKKIDNLEKFNCYAVAQTTTDIAANIKGEQLNANT